MTRKFPKSVSVTILRMAASASHHWHYIIQSTDGTYLGEGWTDGTKTEARSEAWNHLEQIGLVVDE